MSGSIHLDVSPGKPVPVPFRQMRRLFSSFARGAPGLGLLLLRLATGSALICEGVITLLRGAPSAAAVLQALLVVLGVLLVAGLWTPIAGALAAVVSIVGMVSHPASWPAFLPIAVMAAALALLGPGAWSVDARLYGWKQIKISSRTETQVPPD